MNLPLACSEAKQAALLADQNVKWVANVLKRKLTLPEQAMVWILCAGKENAYHYPASTWEKMQEWGTNGVRVPFDSEISTFDASELTSMVIAAHDIGARLSIAPLQVDHDLEDARPHPQQTEDDELEDDETEEAPDRLQITVHLRGGRTGRYFDRHPTMEEAIINLRRDLPGTHPGNPDRDDLAVQLLHALRLGVAGDHAGLVALGEQLTRTHMTSPHSLGAHLQALFGTPPPIEGSE